MGQCGCGNFSPLARFQGPDGSVYVIEIYPGCPDCDTTVGLIISQMTGDMIEMWDVMSIPELPFQEFDGTNWTQGVVKLLTPEAVANEFHMNYGEDLEEIKEAMKNSVRLAVIRTVEVIQPEE